MSMKKTVKQIMACVLAAVMIASTTGMPVLAEEAATEAPAQEDHGKERHERKIGHDHGLYR